jgi:uncharacterized membrane protein YidH (DUF202 family)
MLTNLIVALAIAAIILGSVAIKKPIFMEIMQLFGLRPSEEDYPRFYRYMTIVHIILGSLFIVEGVQRFALYHILDASLYSSIESVLHIVLIVIATLAIIATAWSYKDVIRDVGRRDWHHPKSR